MRTPFAILIFLIVTLFNSSCSDEYVGECNNGILSASLKNDQLERTPFLPDDFAFDQAIVEFNILSNGRIQFGIGMTVDHVCPTSLVDITYTVQTSGIEFSRPIDMVSDVQWSSRGSLSGVTTSSGIDSVGLNQIYSLEETVDISEIFLFQQGHVSTNFSIEFDSFGSFSIDSAYFVDHIEYLAIDVFAHKY